MKQFLLFAAICILLGCQKKEPITQSQVVEWYNESQNFRQKQTDSLLYFGLLIDSNSNNNNSYKAMAAICKGLYYSSKSSYQISLNQYQKAYDLVKNTGPDSLIAKSLTGLGAMTSNLGNDAVAHDYLFKALRISEELKNNAMTAGIYAQLAQDYQLKGDLQKAKYYVNEGLKTVSDKPASTAYILALHTLANIYGMSNIIDSALLIDVKGLALSYAVNSPGLASMFYDNKANCYVALEKYDSASHYFKKCLLIDSAQGNFKQVSDTYLNIGVMYLQKKNYYDAIDNLNYSIYLANKVGYKFGKQNAWATLASSYKAQNNLPNALIAKDSAASIKDQLINEKSVAKIEELRELYDAEKKEQTILLQDSKIARQRIIIIGIAALFSALIFIAFLLNRKREIKKEKIAQEKINEQQEQATIKILQAEEKERQRIASDLHDGVGQLMMAAWLNLQALEQEDLQIAQSQKELLQKSIILVDESCKEVRSVSHTMMPNALLKKGLLNAIKDFIQQIDKKVISINLQTDGLQIALPPHVETILYRIIQECVNNVVKHANASSLDISINNDESGTDVLIEDDGIGFDVQSALQKDGIGLQNIQDRIAYLKGTVHWDSTTNNGTVVSIFIPTTI